MGRYRLIRVNLAALLAAVAVALLAAPAAARMGAQNFYCWDDAANKYQNSLVVSNYNGGWQACIGELNYNYDALPIYDNDTTYPLCQSQGTRYMNEFDHGVYSVDTAADGYAQGFWKSDHWKVVLCDRDGDGSKFDNGDLGYNCASPNDPWCATEHTNDTYVRLSAFVDGGVCDDTYPPVDSCQDVVDSVGCGGNCSQRIITHLMVNFDRNCDGAIDAHVSSSSGLCLYWEWAKPGTGSPFWGGNIQAFLSDGITGEKTVNFRPTGATPIAPASFVVEADGLAAVVSWRTTSEVGIAGFNLYRKEGESWTLVNELPLLTLPPAPGGSAYRVADAGAFAGQSYTWAIGELDVAGDERFHGPFTAVVGIPAAGAVAPAWYGRRVGDDAAVRRGAAPPAAWAAAGAARTAKPATGGVRASARIGVTRDGLYTVSAAQIASILGLPVKDVRTLVARRGLSLSSMGRQVAYVPGHANDGIVFYGEKADGIYTDENVYWIARGAGIPMASANGGSPVAAPNGVFTSALHEEQDNWPQIALYDDPAGDFWTWDFVAAGYPGYDTKSFTIDAPGAVSSGSATLTVTLKGGYDQESVDDDHRVQVALNGALLGEVVFEGLEEARVTAPFDQSLLGEAGNTVTVTSLLVPGLAYNVEWIDSIDLAYQRRYEAVDGSLAFNDGGNAVVTVEGFPSSKVRIFNITDPFAPVEVKGITRTLGADGLYAYSFRPTAAAAYFATAVAGAPASIRSYVPAGLRSANAGADYVVVAPEAFAAGAAELAAYRGSQGLSARVVDLQAVYDEFNFGRAEPVAIRSFLAYASASWKPSPRFVALAGKGTIDYKNRKGIGDNLVPVWLASTPEGLFAADNRFADFDDDGVPEMAIGRLPAVTGTELATMVGKIKAYEAVGGVWRSQALLAADRDDPKAGYFAGDSAEVAALIPADYAVTSINLVKGSIGIDRPRFLAAIGAGTYLVNYIGHGGIASIAVDGLLATADTAILGNSPRLPLTAMFTCMASRYEMYGVTSLGEALLLDADGGSSAVWSATGFSRNDPAVILDKGFVSAVFGGETATVGEAVAASLEGFRDGGNTERYMMDIYNLLGDPALKLR